MVEAEKRARSTEVSPDGVNTPGRTAENVKLVVTEMLKIWYSEFLDESGHILKIAQIKIDDFFLHKRTTSRDIAKRLGVKAPYVSKLCGRLKEQLSGSHQVSIALLDDNLDFSPRFIFRLLGKYEALSLYKDLLTSKTSFLQEQFFPTTGDLKQFLEKDLLDENRKTLSSFDVVGYLSFLLREGTSEGDSVYLALDTGPTWSSPLVGDVLLHCVQKLAKEKRLSLFLIYGNMDHTLVRKFQDIGFSVVHNPDYRNRWGTYRMIATRQYGIIVYDLPSKPTRSRSVRAGIVPSTLNLNFRVEKGYAKWKELEQCYADLTKHLVSEPLSKVSKTQGEPDENQLNQSNAEKLSDLARPRVSANTPHRRMQRTSSRSTVQTNRSVLAERK